MKLFFFRNYRILFSYASHWKHKNRTFRTLTKAFGLRFIVSVRVFCVQLKYSLIFDRPITMILEIPKNVIVYSFLLFF